MYKTKSLMGVLSLYAALVAGCATSGNVEAVKTQADAQYREIRQTIIAKKPVYVVECKDGASSVTKEDLEDVKRKTLDLYKNADNIYDVRNHANAFLVGPTLDGLLAKILPMREENDDCKPTPVMDSTIPYITTDKKTGKEVKTYGVFMPFGFLPLNVQNEMYDIKILPVGKEKEN